VRIFTQIARLVWFERTDLDVRENRIPGAPNARAIPRAATRPGHARFNCARNHKVDPERRR